MTFGWDQDELIGTSLLISISNWVQYNAGGSLLPIV